MALARGPRPPSGSLIFKLTRALFLAPTILRRVRTEGEVWPWRPITYPMSAGFTSSVIRTPRSSMVRVTLTSFGLFTIDRTTSKTNFSSTSIVHVLHFFSYRQPVDVVAPLDLYDGDSEG